MKSAIAIITYRRLPALKETWWGLQRHCIQYKTAVFEDCGQRDATSRFLVGDAKRKHRSDLMADEYWLPSGQQVFLGHRNLGVTGNTNRAIKWFMDETDADHLCLLNDDLHVLGDFVDYYAKGHRDLGVGLFCFCDFTGESYRWISVRARGYRVKLLPRYTGIMMSMTRQLVNKIGYYDSRFGQFGEEHCDYTIRARFAGEQCLDGQDQHCLDLEHNLLKHQEVETSVTGADREKADKEASECMAEAVSDYRIRHYYRPFCLQPPRFVGATKQSGIPFANLHGYQLVNARS